MAGGFGAAGVAGGFGRGLANILQQSRSQQLEKETQKSQQKFQLDMAMVQPLLQWGHDTGDYSGLEEHLGRMDPEIGKRIKKGGSPFTALGPLMQSGGLQPAQQPGTVGENLLPATFQAGGDVTLPPTFMGMPVPTPEQRAERETAGETAKLSAQVGARRKIAESQGMAPAQSVDYALYGTRPPASATTAQAVAVEVPDGKGGWTSTYARFNRATGVFEDPDTGEPLKDARKPLTTASSSLGQYVEQAARLLNFPSANAAAQAGKMAEVEAKAHELAQQQAGATTTGRTNAEAQAPLSTQAKYNLLLKLQEDWNKINQPQREMERQFQLMQTGLSRYDADPIGGSQAVLVTFQKILDPSSVVRESEYARSPEGLALVDRLQGLYDRYSKGGAGVPKEVLAGMVETARQFMAGQQDWNALVHDSISGTATDAGLNPERVFGVAAAGQRGAGAGAGSAAPAPSGPAKGGPPTAPGTVPGVVNRNGHLYSNGVQID